MTILDFLSHLRTLDVEVWADEDQLGISAPKGTLTPALRAELSARKSEILAFLREAETMVVTTTTSVPQVDRTGSLPLSFTQQRLWVLDQLTPGSATYNIPAAVRLNGPLDVGALERSLSMIVQRHESLRTVFKVVDTQPVQMFTAPWPITLQPIDLYPLGEAEREEAAQRLINEAGLRPFDLTHGPLLRTALLRLDPRTHVLILTVHHIVADGWSVGVLIRELMALYDAFCAGKAASLPNLPIQYADFAVWQREWLQSAGTDPLLAYWKQQLGDGIPALDLPLDHPRPIGQSYRGATLRFTLSQPTSAALRVLSQQEGATLFMTLLAAFKTLLFRLVGQDDIVVGSPIAGRTRVETENLIGCFLNTLVLRTDCKGNPTFRELLYRVREVTLGAYAHQELPFEKLVEEVHPRRGNHHTPLIQVLFNMLNFPYNELKLQGLEVNVLVPPDIGAKFDLTLYVKEQNEAIQFELVYNTDLFDRERMVELSEQLQQLLSEVAAHPETPITQISLVTPTARQCLPNPTATLDLTWAGSVTDAFVQNARRVPNALAVVDSNEDWTYAELNAWSNRIAHYLIAAEIQPQELVGIYGHRSAGLVAALLGVLKAGAAFMILDPAYPPARLVAALQVAPPQGWIQITAAGPLPEELDSFLATSCRCRLELPDRMTAEAEQVLADYPSDEPQITVEPDNLAYVAFTSGSTGVPKAIQGTHRPLSHFLQWYTQRFDLSESDRFSMLSGLAHDPLLRDIFTPLWLGATLCVPDPEQISYPGWLADWMQREAITVMHLTPALAQILTEYAESDLLFALHHACFGGDVLTRRDVVRIQAIAPNITCVNFYGATETPQAMGYYIVPSEKSAPVADDAPDSRLREQLPLGCGISDVQLLVLNPAQQLAGIGELGEIYVRTPYLTRGYIGNATATQQRFLINPFTNAPDDRLYRMGDRGRYRPDGTVAFFGRSDQQVKIRGFRVELEEIATALHTHPAVHDQVIMVRAETSGDNELVAYVVLDPASCTVSDLYHFLSAKLPQYMLPAAIVPLASLPLTPNGKIDYNALPAPDRSTSALDESLIAAATPTETAVAKIWSEVFGVARVGIHDNFFELGGHSLLATQVIARVSKAFQVEVSLSRMFEAPTVAGLAQSIEAARQAEHRPAAPALKRIPRDRSLPASFAQQRLWFLHQLEPESRAYNLPTVLRLTGCLHVDKLEAALNEIVQRHEVLRTTFALVEGQLVQVIAAAQPTTLAKIALHEVPVADRAATLQQLATAEVHQPFDLTHGPLLRITLLQFDDTDHVLLLVLHHIVADGWSAEVFIRELMVLYEAFCAHQPSPLPDLAIQYADFAVWQRQWLQDQVLEEQLSYWRQQLSSPPPALELPTDHPRPRIQAFNGAHYPLALSPSLVDAIKALSHQAGVTPFMTLLAAFQTLLYRYTGQSDIMIGSPIAGRTRTETEHLIGFFVNTLVLRTDLSGNPSFHELLGRVRETAIQAYAHQDVPFEKLVEEVQPTRDLSRPPLFQVMFALQNVPMPTLEVSGLKLELLAVDTHTAQFDLSLVLLEGPDGMRGRFEYNTDLFDVTTIDRLAGHWQTLLTSLVAQPQQPLATLPLLSRAERERLLVDWNATATHYPDPGCIHELIAAQARSTPTVQALWCDDHALSYGQLIDQANQLAHFLRAQGIGPETRVAVCLPRSFDLVVSLLAILTAGAAYVPLDPDYPSARLTYMLADAQVACVITTPALADRLPLASVPQLYLDHLRATLAELPTTPPHSGVTEDNLAYIIYTSGSTGQPKGAMNNHAALHNRLRWMQQQYGLTPDDRVLQKTPVSFDVSVWEFFWPLLTGACLVLARPEGHKDSAYLVDLIVAQGVTTLHFVPSMLQSFLSEPTVTRCHSLRRVICSGEALPVAVQNRCLALLDAELHNLYGPTEAAVDVTAWACSHDAELTTVPIGVPIANTQIYLLSPALEPVPIGVLGELYIGGVQVARGYWNQPALTAEKFIPDPFGGQAGARLYRTGDLARYRSDGVIEYGGRRDQQVKVRGVRIELEEIEAALRQTDVVQDAVVEAMRDPAGGMTLIGYVVPQAAGLTAGALRRLAQAHLPEYMVPARWVLLEALPLSPNGKLDRRALPVPDQTRPELDNMFVAPRSVLEEVLAGVWMHVLHVERVGIDDNFFELGGDSIRSIQVLARAREQGLHFSLQQLFQHQTIRKLADELELGTGSAAPATQTQPFGLISEQDRLKLPDGIEDAYPLTVLQTGMLFHSEYNRDSSVYHDVFEFRLQAPFVLEALQKAVQYVAARHAVLRTSFDFLHFSQPLQLVHRSVEIPLQVLDLRHLSADEQGSALSSWSEAEKTLHFDQTHAPLLRLYIHRCTEETFQFTLSFHHAILDGWSIASLLTELFQCYNGLIKGEDHGLEAPPQLQFRDYVALEQMILESEAAQTYWTQKLEDATVMKLPHWHTGPTSAHPLQHGAINIPISADVTQGLKALAREASVPLKSVLLAAHLRVMSLLSGQTDILTGMVANGRLGTGDGERVLGLFLNTLPFRQQLSGGTWLDLIRDTFKNEWEQLPYRSYPMALLQRRHKGDLFETAFYFTNFHIYESLQASGGVQVLSTNIFEQTNFALTANFSQDPFTARLHLSLSYDATRLPEAQSAAIARYYITAMTRMAKQPTSAYQLEPLLDADEQAQLLVTWNNTKTNVPTDLRIHELFEAQVERTPDAIAFTFEDQQFSYRELNARTNQLAHYLKGLGVGPETLVGICVERSPEMMIAMLGVLKAGGAYIPLDPTYPAERLAFMVADAQAPVLLTHQRLANRFSGHTSQVVCLDTDWHTIAQAPCTNLAGGGTAQNLAYVIYTSGSTGQPKGVQIPHSAVVNFLHSMQQQLAPTAQDVLFSVTTFSFDIAVLELFLPLVVGSRVVLVSSAVSADGPRLMEALEQAQATMLQATPTTWQMLLNAGWQGDGRLKILCGGEALSAELARELIAHGQVWNLYGPTETTIWSAIHQVTEIAESIVPIGHPIANTQIYILDAELQLVPVGVPGELHIGGDGLARGYLGHPDLVAGKFVPHPFSDEPGRRLYKTGDLARYRQDGTIEFLGRIDHQVKLRGYRIEQGEIEAVLRQHQAVRETVVVVREDEPGEQRLVAYVVTDQEPAPTTSELHHFAREKLPSYMVPSIFVLLDGLPLTPNGKIDRRALPAPVGVRPTLEVAYVMPRNEVERIIAAVWQEVLQVDQVGIHDNFFDLGGHSLLLSRVHVKLREALQRDLSMLDLFNWPTVSSLAGYISKDPTEQASASQPEIQPDKLAESKNRLNQLLNKGQKAAQEF